MKFFNYHNSIIIILFSLLPLSQIFAQGNRDFMRETGKINVVVAVILVLFAGIVVYLVRLERKLKALERQLEDK